MTDDDLDILADLVTKPKQSNSSFDSMGYARQLAPQYGLDPDFVSKIMTRESGGKHYGNNGVLTSDQGARGAMQVLPNTAAKYGLNADDPKQNVEAGIRYLADISKRFGGDPALTAAGYFAGEDNAERALRNTKGNPKTAAYTRAIAGNNAYLQTLSRLRGGKQTPASQDPLDALADLVTQQSSTGRNVQPVYETTPKQANPSVDLSDLFPTNQPSVNLSSVKPQMLANLPGSIPPTDLSKITPNTSAIVNLPRAIPPTDLSSIKPAQGVIVNLPGAQPVQSVTEQPPTPNPVPVTTAPPSTQQLPARVIQSMQSVAATTQQPPADDLDALAELVTQPATQTTTPSDQRQQELLADFQATAPQKRQPTLTPAQIAQAIQHAKAKGGAKAVPYIPSYAQPLEPAAKADDSNPLFDAWKQTAAIGAMPLGAIQSALGLTQQAKALGESTRALPAAAPLYGSPEYQQQQQKANQLKSLQMLPPAAKQEVMYELARQGQLDEPTRQALGVPQDALEYVGSKIIDLFGGASESTLNKIAGFADTYHRMIQATPGALRFLVPGSAVDSLAPKINGQPAVENFRDSARILANISKQTRQAIGSAKGDVVGNVATSVGKLAPDLLLSEVPGGMYLMAASTALEAKGAGADDKTALAEGAKTLAMMQVAGAGGKLVPQEGNALLRFLGQAGVNTAAPLAVDTATGQPITMDSIINAAAFGVGLTGLHHLTSESGAPPAEKIEKPPTEENQPTINLKENQPLFRNLREVTKHLETLSHDDNMDYLKAQVDDSQLSEANHLLAEHKISLRELNQIETNFANRYFGQKENQNAVNQIGQQASDQAELRGVRQGENLPAHGAEVRQGESRQTENRGGTEGSRQVEGEVKPTVSDEERNTIREQFRKGRQAEEAQPEEKAKVPFMITRDQRQQLLDLGYKNAEIDAMKPEQSQQILEQGKTKTAEPPRKSSASDETEAAIAKFREQKAQSETAKPTTTALDIVQRSMTGGDVDPFKLRSVIGKEMEKLPQQFLDSTPEQRKQFDALNRARIEAGSGNTDKAVAILRGGEPKPAIPTKTPLKGKETPAKSITDAYVNRTGNEKQYNTVLQAGYDEAKGKTTAPTDEEKTLAVFGKDPEVAPILDKITKGVESNADISKLTEIAKNGYELSDEATNAVLDSAREHQAELGNTKDHHLGNEEIRPQESKPAVSVQERGAGEPEGGVKITAPRSKPKAEGLTNAIIRLGGLRPDTPEGRDFARYVSGKEGGRPGVLNKRGKGADDMMTALKAEGYDFESPSEMLDAVRQEQGGKKVYGTAHDFDKDFEQQFKAEAEKNKQIKVEDGTIKDVAKDKDAAPILDRMFRGEHSNEDVKQFTQIAKYQYHVPDDIINGVVEEANSYKSARGDNRNVDERRQTGSPETTGQGISPEERQTGKQPAAVNQLTTEEVARVNELHKSLQEQRIPADEYLKQQGLFGSELNQKQQDLLRELDAKSRRAPVNEKQGSLLETAPTLESKQTAKANEPEKQISGPLTERSGSKNTLVTKEQAETDLERLKELQETNRGSGGPSTEEAKLLARLAIYHVERGVRDFADFSKKIIDDVGDWIKPYVESHLKPIWDEAIAKLHHSEFQPRMGETGQFKEGEPKGYTPVAEREATGIKHEAINAEREARGESPLQKQLRQSDPESYDKGKAIVDPNPQAFREQVAGWAEKPRPLSTDENAALLYDRVNIKNERATTENAIEEAIKTGDADREIKLQGQLAKLLDAQRDNDNAAWLTGSEAGAAFRFRQKMLKDDYTFAAMERGIRLAQGREVTDSQTKALLDLEKKIEERRAEVEKWDAALSDRKAQQVFNELSQQNRSQRRAQTKETLDTEFASLRDQLAKEWKDHPITLSSFPAGLDPEGKLTALVAKMAKNRIRAGINTVEGVVDEVYSAIKDHVEGITKRDVRDLISGYGKTAQMSKEQIDVEMRELKKQMRLTSALEDAQNKQKPLKSGLQREPDSAKVKNLRKLVEAEMRKQGFTQGQTPEARLQAFKTRTENRLKELQDKKAAGDFTTKPKKPEIVLDAHGQKLRADYESAKQEYDLMRMKAEAANRTMGEKIMDKVAKVSRQSLISGITTTEKLGAFGVVQQAVILSQDAIGSVWRRLPLVSKVAKLAPREGSGFNVRAQAEGIVNYFTTWGNKNNQMKQYFKTGKADIDVLYDTKGNKLPPEAVEFIGRIHGLEKLPVRLAEFKRSMIYRLDEAAKKGADITDPGVVFSAGSGAYLDANRTAMLNDNLASQALSWIKNGLRQKGLKKTASIVEAVFPITRIPVNYVTEGIRYAGGGLVRAIPEILYRGIRGTLEQMPEERAESLMRNLKKGTLGPMLAAIAYAVPQVIQFAGNKDQNEKGSDLPMKPGTVRLFGVDLPKWATHHPLIEAMQTFATVRRLQDKMGFTKAMLVNAQEEAKHIPYLEEPAQAVEALRGEDKWRGFLTSLLLSRIIPPDIQRAARIKDEPGVSSGSKVAQFFGAQQEKTGIQRKAENLGDEFKKAIPGLREEVPESKAGLQERIATIIKKGGSADELVNARVELAKRNAADETKQKEKRIKEGNAKVTDYDEAKPVNEGTLKERLQALTSSDDYKSMSAKEKAKALTGVVEATKAEKANAEPKSIDSILGKQQLNTEKNRLIFETAGRDDYKNLSTEGRQYVRQQIQNHFARFGRNAEANDIPGIVNDARQSIGDWIQSAEEASQMPKRARR